MGLELRFGIEESDNDEAPATQLLKSRNGPRKMSRNNILGDGETLGAFESGNSGG